MSSTATFVFIDLAGSTAAYAALGNARVADVISKVTQWIGRVCEAHQGRVLKFLGDGVLAQFPHSTSAVHAAVFLQQSHTERLQKWPAALRMGLKIGLTHGTVVRMGGDAYGDPLNLAARLSDMAGDNAIWADESVIAQLHLYRAQAQLETASEHGAPLDMKRYRSLGMIRVRGMPEPHSVFQIEWSEDISTDLMTVRGVLHEAEQDSGFMGGGIALAWFGHSRVFSSRELPIVIGRAPDSAFVVNDQRVSRNHARLEFINGALVLTDLSSFGTCVRFTENPQAEVQLRRNQCVLHSTGEIALGAPFADFSAPVMAFNAGAFSSHEGAYAAGTPTHRSYLEE